MKEKIENQINKNTKSLQLMRELRSGVEQALDLYETEYTTDKEWIEYTTKINTLVECNHQLRELIA